MAEIDTCTATRAPYGNNPAPRPEMAPGTVFAGHVIEAAIGRGGMGIVYRARQRERGRVVALKVVLPELLEQASVRARFVEEAAAAAAIEHPNVVPVYDVGERDGIAYLVMRHVSGMDLRARVAERGPLTVARAAEVAAKVGGALDSLHRIGFVHRDVKPSNVLLARDGGVFLADFGLARRLVAGAGVTRTGQWVGTIDYVAPEQIRGERIDARADVYGLGGLLHFALTGRPPYERENDAAKLWAHLCAKPPLTSRLRPGVPAPMDAVVARALAKRPGERFASAGELGRSALLAAGGRTDAAQRPLAAAA